MNGLFVVWLATTGAFNMQKVDTANQACILANQYSQSAVFQVAGPTMRGLMLCAMDPADCNLPTYTYTSLSCVGVAPKQVVVPAHWDLQ